MHLKIGAAVSNNWVIRDSVNLAAEKVTEGGNLATQLERSGYFPPMMVQMIKSGESSGELDRMLERASDHARPRSHHLNFNLIGACWNH